MQGEPVRVKPKESDDFTVLVFWTTYIGKLNRDHVSVWERQAQENQKAGIRVLKINMDFQEFWGEDNLRKVGMK